MNVMLTVITMKEKNEQTNTAHRILENHNPFLENMPAIITEKNSAL